MHTFYDQLVEDVRVMKKSADEIPLFANLLKDVEKPVVSRSPELLSFYAGVICVLNIIKSKEESTCNSPENS